MKRSATPFLILLLLASACFAMATALQPRILSWSQGSQNSVLEVLLGDGRKMFANHFFIKADVYFHSGYYPSIFDHGPSQPDTAHMEGREEHHDKGHEEEPGFLGPPRDSFEKFGRHFMITQHSHLEHGQEREILPWLRLSAELDPQRVETYTVSAFWLRSRLGKVKEAEQFLREGLRANPGSHEILFALGRLYSENYHDAARARNVWELALRRWHEQDAAKKDPSKFVLEEITVNLARLEESEGNLQGAIDYLEEAKRLSPSPRGVQKQIEEIKARLVTPPPSFSTQSP
jgi:tetratricopeptide (TPR) repeat protein